MGRAGWKILNPQLFSAAPPDGEQQTPRILHTFLVHLSLIYSHSFHLPSWAFLVRALQFGQSPAVLEPVQVPHSPLRLHFQQGSMQLAVTSQDHYALRLSIAF